MDKIKDLIIKIEALKTDLKFDEAIKIIEESLVKYNSDYRLYEELSDIYLFKWNITKAYKSIKYALSLNEESATGNYLIWFILLSKNKIPESIYHLEKSNKLIWNNAEVLRNLWWAYTLSWEMEKWIIILKRALLISPEDKLIKEDLAMALIWKWDIKEWNTILKKIWKEEDDLYA